MSKQVVGTCGNCGGVVTLPSHYLGLFPPKPTCESCGSTAQTWRDQVLPMNPRCRECFEAHQKEVQDGSNG